MPLVDGVARRSDYPDDEYIETGAIAQRFDVSSEPIALINKVGSLVRRLEYADKWTTYDFSPTVVLFKGKGEDELAINEKRREKITSDNNDYWESVFEYDINQDGNIPTYAPSDYPSYSPPSKKYINGKKVKGTKGHDNLEGKKKDDCIDGKKGHDIINGGKGHDVLYGKEGFDEIYGSQGKDYLDGGADDDVLSGGPAADVFAMSKGEDVITDFDINKDRIAIPEEYIDKFTVENGPILSGNQSVIVAVDGFGQLQVRGVDYTFDGNFIDTVQENMADIFLREI